MPAPSPELCRISIRLPRPLGIGIAATILVVAAVLLVTLQFYFRSLAIREIVDAGGRVEMRPRGPEWLRDWLGEERMTHFDEAIHVKLSYSRARDETLGRLPRLPRIRRLDLNGTRVTDAGIVPLRGLTKLQWLWLSDTAVSDAGLAHLKGLPRRELLVLRNAPVTDDGVAELQRALPALKIQR